MMTHGGAGTRTPPESRLQALQYGPPAEPTWPGGAGGPVVCLAWTPQALDAFEAFEAGVDRGLGTALWPGTWPGVT